MLRRVVLLVLVLASGLCLIGQARAVDFSLTYLEDRYIQQIGVDDESLHSWRLQNSYAEPTEFVCTIFGEQPESWFTFLCTGDICVFDSANVMLGHADTESLSVHAFPLGVAGAAYLTLRVRSLAAEPETLEVTLATLSDVTTLLVEDDGPAESFTSYYRTIADAAGLLYGVWDTDLEPILPGDLDGKDNVVWFTGSAGSTLNAAEQQATENYLAAGGHLLISSQNLAGDLAGPFLEEVLHAQLDNGDVGSTHVDGVPGDDVGDGLSFDIAGGDGAGNQTSPDGLLPMNHASASFEYDTGDVAGIRFTNTVQKLVYLGFGIEGIDSQVNRQELFDAVLDWFDAPVSSVDDFTSATTLVQAGPNPFSGRHPIAIQWSSGASATPWKVDWFDARGRLVGRQAGFSEDGIVRAEWDGATAGRSLGSGVYLYRISAGSRVTTGRALYIAQ